MAEDEQVQRTQIHADQGQVGRRTEAAEHGKAKRDAKGRAYATGRRKECGRARLDQAGPRQDHRQRQGREDLFRASGAAHDPAPAADRGQPRRPVRRHRAPSMAADFRARRARCATASPGRWWLTSPALRAALKPGGFLTRDPRAVERKKYGRPKARRSFQFSKR